jgi:hypothetical protein
MGISFAGDPAVELKTIQLSWATLIRESTEEDCRVVNSERGGVPGKDFFPSDLETELFEVLGVVFFALVRCITRSSTGPAVLP